MSSLLLNRRVRIDGPAHPATVALQLLREIESDLPSCAPQLSATTAELDRVSKTVRATGIDPTGEFTVLVATHPTDNRSWPAAAMHRQTAVSQKGPILWLRGPDEADLVLPPGVILLDHAVGQLRDLVALGALVGVCGGRVFGPDQGAIHVLCAAGAASTVFYGPQDPARTAPMRATVLVKRGGPACVPCNRRRCHHPDGPVCMDFTVDEATTIG